MVIVVDVVLLVLVSVVIRVRLMMKEGLLLLFKAN
jgi:hypothetical protein